jgi:hypothetical protein
MGRSVGVGGSTDPRTPTVAESLDCGLTITTTGESHWSSDASDDDGEDLNWVANSFFQFFAG